MANKVTTTRQGEVMLGTTRFPIVDRVRALDITQPPERRVQGDITRDSNPNLSIMSWSDFRGGIGLDIMEGFETNRCWESNLNIRFDRSIVLGPLATVTTNTFSSNPGAYAAANFSSNVYMVASTDIWAYQANGDTWTDTTRNISGGYSSDMIEFPANDGNIYLCIADGVNDANNYLYKSSTTITAAFTAGNQPTMLFTQWDGKLWGISRLGQLWWAYLPGSENLVAKLESRTNSPDGAGALVQAMWVGLLPDGVNTAIHVKTNGGAYVYDALNDRFVEIEGLPIANTADASGNATFGGDALFWQGRHYMTFGAQLLEYDPTTGIVRDVFWAAESGLPASRKGVLVSLETTSYELFVATEDGTSSAASRVYAWNRVGWYEVFDAGGATHSVYEMLASNRTSNSSDHFTRLYILEVLAASNVDPAYINVAGTHFNPKGDSSYTYAASGTLKTSWFHADQVDVDKLAVRLKVETADTSANETVKIEYAVDYNEGASDANYLTLANSTYTDGIIDTTAAGVSQTTFVFPLDTNDVTVAPVGKTFRAIRFKVSLARGGTTTNSPRLISMTLEYRKKYERKEGFQFVVDLTKNYNGLTPAKMRAALQTLVESNTLSEFTFRDDTANRNYYVDVRIPTAEESTGHLEEGQTLVEVREL